MVLQTVSCARRQVANAQVTQVAHVPNLTGDWPHPAPESSATGRHEVWTLGYICPEHPNCYPKETHAISTANVFERPGWTCHTERTMHGWTKPEGARAKWWQEADKIPCVFVFMAARVDQNSSIYEAFADKTTWNQDLPKISSKPSPNFTQLSAWSLGQPRPVHPMDLDLMTMETLLQAQHWQPSQPPTLPSAPMMAPHGYQQSLSMIALDARLANFNWYTMIYIYIYDILYR